MNDGCCKSSPSLARSPRRGERQVPATLRNEPLAMHPSHVALVAPVGRLHTDGFLSCSLTETEERRIARAGPFRSCVQAGRRFLSAIDRRCRGFHPSRHGRQRYFPQPVVRRVQRLGVSGEPKAKAILGVHAYATLADIPGSIDLAVLIVPASGVLERGGSGDRQGGQGVGGHLGRFQGDRDPKARRWRLQLRDKVRAAGIPLIGPNCLGVINTDPTVRMNAAFGRKMPAAGNLAFLSQSGALCTSVLDYAEERQMGFSKFISFGNKADVNEIDMLDYLAKDEKTSVIAMYLEDVTNGRQFIETVRDIFW